MENLQVWPWSVSRWGQLKGDVGVLELVVGGGETVGRIQERDDEAWSMEWRCSAGLKD